MVRRGMMLWVVAVLLAGAVTGVGFAGNDGGWEGETAASTDPQPERFAIDLSAGSAREAEIAVDPEDPLHMVVAYFEWTRDEIGWTSVVDVAVTFDGGASWHKSVLPDVPGTAVYDPVGRGADPTVEILPDGTVLVVWLGVDAYKEVYQEIAGVTADSGGFVWLGNRIVMARSFDGGLTWPDAQLLAQGLAVSAAAPYFYDKPWLAQGPDGTLLLAVNVLELPPTLDPPATLDTENPINNAYTATPHYAVSTDGGDDWNVLGILPRLPVAGGHFGSPLPAIGADGTLYIVVYDREESAWLVARSNDLGASWTFDGLSVLCGRGCLGTLGTDGEQLFLAYPTALPDDEWTLSFVAWNGSWGSPILLDRSVGQMITAYPAGLAVAADGAVTVSHWHQEQTASADFRLVSIRGGVVSPPLTLDTVDTSWSIYDAANRGDYHGLAAAPGGLVTTWVTGSASRASELGNYDLVGAFVPT